METIRQFRQLIPANVVHDQLMNNEGAEITALQGADATIRRYQPQFAIATDPVVDGQTTSERVEANLRDYGYRVATRRVAHGAISTSTSPGAGP